VNLLFWLAASLPLVLLAMLFAAFLWLGPAGAADTACKGENLLVEMKASDPERYAALQKEAEAVPNGKGIFWKVEKDGVQPSYLLGTMHLTDPRVLAMPQGAAQAFASSDVVLVESDEMLNERKAMAALLAKPDLTMFTNGTTISKLLTAEERERLETGLKRKGILLGMVEKMKPWMIASFVSLPACERSRKVEGLPFLDKKLAEDAVAQGKQLKGLESMAEQLQAMNDLPIEFHIKALVETVDLGDRMDDITATMIDLYTTGEIGMIVPMLDAVTEDKDGMMSDYAAFEQRIVIDRNHVMADRSAPVLEKGGAFMAVGALHLPGEQGAISLLQKKGFRLIPVSAP
jgi:uncharacterized protein YbaP (TraB family)